MLLSQFSRWHFGLDSQACLLASVTLPFKGPWVFYKGYTVYDMAFSCSGFLHLTCLFLGDFDVFRLCSAILRYIANFLFFFFGGVGYICMLKALLPTPMRFLQFWYLVKIVLCGIQSWQRSSIGKKIRECSCCRHSNVRKFKILRAVLQFYSNLMSSLL